MWDCGDLRRVATARGVEQQCSLSTLPLHFFRAEAFELLPWSKRLEMLSSPPAIERGKATEWGCGPHLSTQVSNPSPSSHQYTLPPSMALRPVAVLWDKCVLFSTYSFLLCTWQTCWKWKITVVILAEDGKACSPIHSQNRGAKASQAFY